MLFRPTIAARYLPERSIFSPSTAAAAMLHLQKLLLPVRRSATPVHYSLHRALLSTAAAGASPVHFAADDFLVTTCGLTKEQAAKAAKCIAHCKSPFKANAVLSFLAGPALSLSKADIAHLVFHDARVLNCDVEKTLRPRVDAFVRHGFTPAQIRTFIRQAPWAIRQFNAHEKLGFWVPFLGSPETFLYVLKRNFYLVTSSLDRVVKANIKLLRESGLSDGDVTKICVTNARLLTTSTDRFRAMLARAEQLGIPRNSLLFKYAVTTATRIGPETLAAKLRFIGEILGCSDVEMAKVVRLNPLLLAYSTQKLHRVSEFLTKVAGIDRKYILGNTKILMYSLEQRIAPRHYVMKVLLEKGLMRKEQSFYTLVALTDKMFRSRYIICYKDVLPGLAEAYESCKGKLPTCGMP